MFECEAIFIFINPVSSSFKVKRFFSKLIGYVKIDFALS